MIHILRVAAIVVVCALTGCSTKYWSVYDLSLQSVERAEGLSDAVVVGSREDGRPSYQYEDDQVRITFLPTSHEIAFELQNLTKRSILVHWDAAAFVGPDGRSHRILHTGVRYTDASRAQPPSTVVRGTTLVDTIISAENVRYDAVTGWGESPFLPTTTFEDQHNAIPQDVASSIVSQGSRPYVGSTVQVLLPLESSKGQDEYIFTFHVDGFRVFRQSGTSPAVSVPVPLTVTAPPRKSPGAALAASLGVGLLGINGAGQWYNGEKAKAAMFVSTTLFAAGLGYYVAAQPPSREKDDAVALVIMYAVGNYVWAGVDAYISASRINRTIDDATAGQSKVSLYLSPASSGAGHAVMLAYTRSL